MFEKLTDPLTFQSRALVLRSERQRLIASNIANADTPGYVSRDFNFQQAMSQAMAKPAAGTHQTASVMTSSHARHLPLTPQTTDLGNALAYAPVSQPSMDSNTVDMDRERSNFTDNAVRYESALRFINSYSKTILSAIQGQ